MVIPNRYKDTFDDFIENLDVESPDWFELIDKKLSNLLKFKSSFMGPLKENCLDKNISNRSL